MKPIRLASGVRNSWLALAMKSERMRATARSCERSDSTTMARAPSGSGGSITMTSACTSRATGTGMLSSALCPAPVAKARSMAARMPGWRSTAGMSAPKAARAAALARRA